MAINHRLASAVVLLLVGIPTPALAQQRGYAGGALVLMSWGPENIWGGSPSTTFDNASAESTTYGVVAEAGGWVSKSTAFGVEFVVPFHRNALTREFFYTSHSLTESRYREQHVMGILRQRLRVDGEVHVDLIAGAGVIFGNSLDRVARQKFGATAFEPFGAETTASGTTWGILTGADLTMDVGSHVSVVPGVRLLIAARGDTSHSRRTFSNMGLDRYVYRANVGLRARF